MSSDCCLFLDLGQRLHDRLPRNNLVEHGIIPRKFSRFSVNLITLPHIFCLMAFWLPSKLSSSASDCDQLKRLCTSSF